MGFHWRGLALGATNARKMPLERRSEERQDGSGQRASLIFRSKEVRVPVLNISARGTMVEWSAEPRLGESIIVRFEGCTPVMAFVRWVREGRVGLAFGHEIILC